MSAKRHFLPAALFAVRMGPFVRSIKNYAPPNPRLRRHERPLVARLVDEFNAATI